MNACIKMILAAMFVFSANFASATTPYRPSISKPTAEQCVKIRSELEQYIVYINAWLAAQPVRKQALLKPYVDYAIAEAKKLVNKLCPQVVRVNLFECNVNSSDFTNTFPFGLNSSGGAVADGSHSVVACVTQNACLNIVAQKFNVGGAAQTSRCATAGDPSAIDLTDAEVQTKINAIP